MRTKYVICDMCAKSTETYADLQFATLDAVWFDEGGLNPKECRSDLCRDCYAKLISQFLIKVNELPKFGRLLMDRLAECPTVQFVSESRFKGQIKLWVYVDEYCHSIDSIIHEVERLFKDQGYDNIIIQTQAGSPEDNKPYRQAYLIYDR